MKLQTATAILLFSLSLPAWTANGTLTKEQSSLTFTGIMLGVTVIGTFPSFDATFHFDPAVPEDAQVHVVVTTADIFTNHEERDIALRSLEWFDTRTYPTAEFTSRSVNRLSSDRLLFSGDITIKGKTQPLTIEVTLSSDGANNAADGSFVLDRHDFAIGTGGWANNAIVAKEVTVNFHLQSSPHLTVPTDDRDEIQ